MQTPVRLQTTSHLLSKITQSCMDIISKVYSFVTFSPKELSQLIARRQKEYFGSFKPFFPLYQEGPEGGRGEVPDPISQFIFFSKSPTSQFSNLIPIFDF